MERLIEKTQSAYRRLVQLAFILGIIFCARETIVQLHDSYVVAEDFSCLAKHQENLAQEKMVAQASMAGSMLRDNPCNVKFWVGDFSVSQRAWYSGRPGYNRVPFLIWGFVAFFPALALFVLGKASRRILLPVVQRVTRDRFEYRFEDSNWNSSHDA